MRSRALFNVLLRHLDEIAQGNQNARFSDEEIRHAIVTLLCRVVIADGFVMLEETEQLQSILKERYETSMPDWEAIMAEVEAARADHEPVFATVQILLRSLDEAERIEFVRSMVSLAKVDGEVHPNEKRLIERVANLLKVEHSLD